MTAEETLPEESKEDAYLLPMLQELAEDAGQRLRTMKAKTGRIELEAQYADGVTACRASDIDVGVLPSGSIPDGVLSEIREELENSRIPYRVELIDLAKASPGFSAHVQRTGILWNA